MASEMTSVRRLGKDGDKIHGEFLDYFNLPTFYDQVQVAHTNNELLKIQLGRNRLLANIRRIHVPNTPDVVPVVVGQDGGADLEGEGERRGRVRLLDEPLLQRRQPNVLGDVGHDVGIKERPPTVCFLQ